MCGIRGTNGNGYFEESIQKIYLFKKSFRNIQNKDALRDDLLLLKVRSVCGKNVEMSVTPSEDPILYYILGFSERPSNETILDYYRMRSTSRAECVDLYQVCLFLGEEEYARKLVNLTGLDPGPLSMSANDNFDFDKSEIDCSFKWLDLLRLGKEYGKAKAHEAEEIAEHCGFLHRFRTGHKVSTLCEMAARGYSWDAFILMYLLDPSNEVLNSLGSFIWESLDLDWVKEIKLLSAKEANFARLMKLGLNSWECYNILKASFAINKESLYARSSIYSGIRLCLLSAACEVDNDISAHEMMKDFLSSSDGVFLQECLPALQRYYFEQAFTVMHDFIHLVLHISDVMKNDVFTNYEDNSFGILTNLLNKCINGQILPLDDLLVEAKRGISDVLYTFIGDVLNSSELLLKRVDFKVYVIAALRIAEVLFTDNVTRSSTFIIYDLLCEIKNGEKLVNQLLEKIDSEVERSITSMRGSIRNCLISVKLMFADQSHPKSLPDASTVTNQLDDHTVGKNTREGNHDSILSLPKSHISVVTVAESDGADDDDYDSSLYCSSSINNHLEKLQDETVAQSVVPINFPSVDEAAGHNISFVRQADQQAAESIVPHNDLVVPQNGNSYEQPTLNATQDYLPSETDKCLQEKTETEEKVEYVTELDRMLQIGISGNESNFSPDETCEKKCETGSELPNKEADRSHSEVKITVTKIVGGLNDDSIDSSPFVPLTMEHTGSLRTTDENITSQVPDHVTLPAPVAHSERKKSPQVSKFDSNCQSGRPRHADGDKKSSFNSGSISSGDNRGQRNSWRNSNRGNDSSDNRGSPWKAENSNNRGGRSSDFAGHRRGQNDNQVNGGSGYRNRNEHRGQGAHNN